MVSLVISTLIFAVGIKAVSYSSNQYLLNILVSKIYFTFRLYVLYCALCLHTGSTMLAIVGLLLGIFCMILSVAKYFSA